jgi:serine/threonine-protein kinase
MGAVYEAVQLRLNKRVAIKIMSREHTANSVTLARFHREAEITSRLGHPHLINVIDFGTSGAGEPYLVMEMLDGEDLDMRLQKVGRLPLEATVRITRQAASALGAAHAQDVVHRDMKPGNIFLLEVPGETEFVKVLDFGISKMKAAQAKLTRASAVVGTPIYMSPEQTRGDADNTDHRADQWALACIAWEMLSGHPPFESDDVNTLFLQINRADPPPLARHVPDLVLGVESVLRKALSKRVVERYPSIRDFAHALEDAAFG